MRLVLGPDEPFLGRSQEDMEADHWTALQQIAQTQEVVTVAAELKRLRHDVVPSARLIARIGGGPQDSSG